MTREPQHQTLIGIDRWNGIARALGTLVLLGLVLGAAGCRKTDLGALSGLLVFSSPDQPAAVTQPDAGLVEIAFGQVTLAATKSLTLSAVSLGSPVTLVALRAIQSDPEFSLPLALGAVAASPPTQTSVSFTPSSLGAKSAIYQLTAAAPATGTITIELTGTGVPNGLTVSPDPADFGQVEINHSQPVALTISNHGQQPASLAFSSIQGANATFFQLATPASNTLAPGSSTTVDVAFAPLSVGPANASFTVSGLAESAPVSVSLAGIGIQSWLQAPSPLDFGFVQITDTLVKSALVTNVSSYTTLHVIAPAPLVGQPNGSSAFGAAPLKDPLPLAIGPGQSVAIAVSFAPRSLDAFTGTLFVATDDPDDSYLAIPLQGYGGGPRLSCLPQLGFDPTPVGFSVTEPTICTNTGADIPSHPEIGLEIAQSGLATDNPVFAAVLLLPDGGLPGAGNSIFLTSGQSVGIGVSFQPDDAGSVVGRLSVASNDLNDLDAGTLLTGEGFVPGPCALEAQPRQLPFGEVPPGNTGQLQLDVRNVGKAFCVLTKLALDPSSDAAFSLPAGRLDHAVLSYATNTYNPTSLPTSLVVDVEFAPTASEPGATGTVEIDAFDLASPIEVALSGSSEAGCLHVRPPSYDFGVVGLNASGSICSPDGVTFTAENLCPFNVTLLQLQIIPGLAPEPQFALESSLFLPLTLATGSEASFQVSFVPSRTGPELSDIYLGSTEFEDPFLLTLRGDAETSGIHVDTFTVPAPPTKVDLLWVLDEDDDYPQVASLVQVLPQFIDTLDQAQLDYRIAVTSTDTCDAGASDQGAFEPCDHCLSTTSSDPLYVTPSLDQPATALADLFGFFDIAPEVGLCSSLNGDEHFFDALAAALSPDALSGHNSGFIRPDAYLAIVLVNGDAEDNAATLPFTTSLAQLTSLVENLKPDPSLVSVSYINSGAGTLEAGQQLGQLVQATGGQEIDTSVPTAVWQASLLDLITFTTGQAVFGLSTQPASPTNIQVEVNGTPSSAWSYEPGTNEIIFNAGSMPAPGATITVTYGVGCS